MPNTIALAKNYIGMLDEVYKLASTASDLTSGGEIVRAGTNAKEILIPQISMDGLKDYDRNSGYKSGNVKLEWKTVAFNYDRGIKFSVDEMDNEETINLAFGRLGAEFMRTQVAPEADAFTYATLCAVEGISKDANKTYSTGEEVLDALLAAWTKMDEDEVPATERYLKITPTLLNLARSVKTYINADVLDMFAGITAVPQSRFYTEIELLDGTTGGEEAGGFKKKDTTGADINFMVIHKPAVIKYDKHIASDIIPPATNADADAYIMKYRKYGLVSAFPNKAAGIYLSHKTAG